MNDPIDLLLQGCWPDPDDGAPLGVPTRAVMIEDTLEGTEGAAVRALDLGSHLAVVSDVATHAALGARVERALRSTALVTSVVLPANPHADMETVADLREACARADALVAVGAGTINDLCKYASFAEDKPYVVFGTAPSMNGYTSANAAITARGHKKSLPARVAAAVFLDLGVLCAAPPRMIRAGLGDSLCRPTAQSDWLLAHLLLDQPYREAPFALLAGDEEALFAEPQALLAGDREAMRRLARTLVLSGFGMTLCGSSHPASQGEHLVSHYIDMMHAAEQPLALHGEQVGVTTLTMAALQEHLLAGPPPRVGETAVQREDVVAHFGPERGAACWEEFAAKRLDTHAARCLNERIAARWDGIRTRIAAIARPEAELREVLARVRAPLSCADLGLDRRDYRAAILHARELRNRYTFLDLAAEARLLEETRIV